MLYTCAKEFDFLGWEMPNKTSLTLLLPTAVTVASIIIWRIFHSAIEDEAICYNLAQTGVYAVMAVGIMRLKLFLTPHLCIIAGLVAKTKVCM